ncbi:MAG: mechanosensitive ion channel family protein [Anaerolineae bacterium]|nr:mechanosensitive ion channel family protein [Anaerolineae bacterium]
MYQLIQEKLLDDRARYTWRKTSSYIIAFLGLLLLGRIWIQHIQGLATFLGLASAGLAIALQGPLTDLAGFLLIISRRPFEVGDRVEIGNHAGDVVDIRFLQFTLLEIGNWVHADQSTGRILHIPNRQVFNHSLANYNKGIEYIWHEIEVMITFESNWEKAKALLTEIAKQDTAHLSYDASERVKAAARRFYIVYKNLTPIVYMRVEPSGILLTLRFLVNPRRRRSTEQGIWEDILKAFAQHPDIEFAYPTQRFYYRQAEDKVPPFVKSMPPQDLELNNYK